MKRILFLLALLASPVMAQPISQMPPATLPLSPTDLLPVVQGTAPNTVNRKATIGNIVTSVTGNPNTWTSAQTWQGPSGFWTNSNPFAGGTTPIGIVHRFTNRVTFGAATAESGDFCFPNRTGCAVNGATTKDWYEAFEATRSSPYGFRTSWAQVASLATNGGIGVLGAARTSDVTDPSLVGLQLGMGTLSACINDNTTIQQLCTAGYDVAFRLPGAGIGSGMGTVGRETDIANEGNLVQITPADLYPSTGFTTGYQINSGASDPNAVSASAALTIGNNRANFLSGVVFGQNALAGLTYDGNGKAMSGAASAIRMGAFHQQEWWVSGGSAPSFVVTSNQLTPANVMSIIARDTGIDIGGAGSGQGLAIRALYPSATTGAYLQVTPAFNTSPLTLSAQGQTNASLSIQAAGTGMINFTASGGLSINGTAAVSCAAGTVSLATLVVTNGLVTHC